MKTPWHPAELALLAELYPDMHTDDIAALMGRSISSVRNAAFLARLTKTAEYLITAGRIQAGKQHPAHVGSRFKPGHSTWNAGMKGWVAPGTEATRFKPGSKPQTWKPIGTVRLDRDGTLHRKVADTGNRRADWQPVQAAVWIAAHGPIPAGCVCVFKRGKHTSVEAEIRAEDIECLTRADLMRRNSYHNNYPPEVAQLIQLRGALNRQINKRTRAQRETT